MSHFLFNLTCDWSVVTNSRFSHLSYYLYLKEWTKHIRDLERTYGMEDCKAVETPMVNEHDKHIIDGNDVRPEMNKENATRHRASCAKINYLAQDQNDIQCAEKEISRRMANPEVGDRIKIKRLGRYLKGEPRICQMFPIQNFSIKL